MDKNKRVGKFVKKTTGEETYSCYIPLKLPPNPPIQIEKFYNLLDKANVSLGELNGIKTNLSDFSIFLKFFTKKEAILSSQIEGTQSSLSDFLLSDALLFKNGTKNFQTEDEIEVFNYIEAMNFALKKIKTFPLSRRLLCDIHKILLTSSRGEEKTPGIIRTSQNWISGSRPGNAIFVPAPPENLNECIGDFEKFLNDKTLQLPSLIKTALAHAQFETIHPFLDGNGRVGRLIITLMLNLENLLEEPLLYLSLYFKTHQKEYYRLLQLVRETGDWESWIEFFLKGVFEISKQTFETAQKIKTLFEEDLEKIKQYKIDTVGILSAFEVLKKHPISNVKNITTLTKKSKNTILRSLRELEKIGMVEEITGKYSHKMFKYTKYLEIINKGTDINK